MKKIVYCALALLATLACKKIDPVSDGSDCSVSLNLIGDIEVSESPLSRAESANDLYAVQVYNGNEVFAWGIFDNLSDLNIHLKQGSTYKVIVVKVAEAKSHLSSYFSLTNNGINSYAKSAVGPYKVYNGSGTATATRFIKTNQFFYKFLNTYTYYTSASLTATTSSTSWHYLCNLGVGSLLDISYPTCSDWFYGEASGFVPSGNTDTWNIPLKRVGFKLKYELSGVTDGSVTVTVKNETRTFFQNTTTTPTYESETQFIAFSDTKSAWQYADNYMENLTVSVSWARGIGVTQNLGSKTVSVKRNCLNNIKITLGNDDRSAGVSLNVEDDASMGSAGNSMTLQ